MTAWLVICATWRSMCATSRDGLPVTGDVHAAVAKLAASMPSQFSSTAQDLARGKSSEIDYLNGLIVKRGEALGIATPANRVLWALVKLMEGKRYAAGSPAR